MSPKSQPFSLRLSQSNDVLVSREARRTRRSKGAVVEALADEALRVRRYPGIAFRGSDWARRPWVIGTALDVWEIVAAARRYGSIEEMASATDLTEAQIGVAMAYGKEFTDEIADAIQDNERSLEELRLEFPTIRTVQAG